MESNVVITTSIQTNFSSFIFLSKCKIGYENA